MKLIFVHGWSVSCTDTYGDLPKILAAQAATRGLSLELIDIHLGRYISFRDEVRMDDVVRAFNQALRETLPAPKSERADGIAEFACITHSTGAPVVRCWMERYYGAAHLKDCPLAQLVMLAPANHGSALATLGSARVGRLKAWFQGIEPGTGILEWLELGSTGGRQLNEAWLDYRPTGGATGFRPFVLSGETIDKKLYDHVNSYTGEVGSDGVVRVAAANLDYSWLTLRQGPQTVTMAGGGVATLLRYDGKLRCSTPCPFLVVRDASHSGDKLGIMRSPTPANAAEKPVVGAILDALAVKTATAYDKLATDWAAATDAEQNGRGQRRRFFQIVFQVTDDQGATVPDYDVILLGTNYDPDRLPRGFFVDKQANKHARHRITFYLDFDAMMKVPESVFGFRIAARPDRGFGYYLPAEFRSNAKALDDFVDPNTTLYIDIVLRRQVDEQTARLDPASGDALDFKDLQPTGHVVP